MAAEARVKKRGKVDTGGREKKSKKVAPVLAATVEMKFAPLVSSFGRPSRTSLYTFLFLLPRPGKGS